MSEAKTISVVIKYPISHDGVRYNKGDTFDCPADIYDALLECFDTGKDGAVTKPVDKTGEPSKDDREAQVKFWNRKTVDEIKTELETRGIEFPDDGKKAELIDILVGPADEETL